MSGEHVESFRLALHGLSRLRMRSGGSTSKTRSKTSSALSLAASVRSHIREPIVVVISYSEVRFFFLASVSSFLGNRGRSLDASFACAAVTGTGDWFGPS